MARNRSPTRESREAELLYERASALFVKAGPLFQTQLRIAIANHVATLRQHAAALERRFVQDGSVAGLYPGTQPAAGLSVLDGPRPSTPPPPQRR